MSDGNGKVTKVRVSLVRERTDIDYGKATSPSDVARIADAALPPDRDREYFGVMLVNVRLQVTEVNLVSVGTLTGSIVHPREVYKAAILGNAYAIIVFHNHPSGDPSPSREDRELTRRLFAAGRTLGIALLDHVIIGDGGGGFYSFQGDGGPLL